MFFKQVVSFFDSESAKSSFVDNSVDTILAALLSSLDSSLGASGWNTDKPPYFHVQSIGHVCGLDEYVPATALGKVDDSTAGVLSHRDPDLWGSLATRMLGVSVHPKYGGWYAYRMLVVLDGVSWPQDRPRPPPLSFLSSEDKATIIREYNKSPDMGRWRDFTDKKYPLVRYDATQFLYFHEKSTEKRRRILELLKAEQQVLEERVVLR